MGDGIGRHRVDPVTRVNEQAIERTVFVDAVQRWRSGFRHAAAHPPVAVRARVSAGMAGRTESRKAAGVPQASDHANLFADSLRSPTVPLGPPVSVYAVRRFADQAPERADQPVLLWRSDVRNGSSVLSSLDDSLIGHPPFHLTAGRWILSRLKSGHAPVRDRT